jgi:hypothetical protein
VEEVVAGGLNTGYRLGEDETRFISKIVDTKRVKI